MKKIISLVLSVVMLLGLVPVSIFADGPAATVYTDVTTPGFNGVLFPGDEFEFDISIEGTYTGYALYLPVIEGITFNTVTPVSGVSADDFGDLWMLSIQPNNGVTVDKTAIATVTATVDNDAEAGDIEIKLVDNEVTDATYEAINPLGESYDEATIAIVGFEDDTVTYDGESHTIEVSGLPEDFDDVQYTLADTDDAFTGAIEAGEYDITALVNGTKEFSATLTIEKADLGIIGLSAVDKTYDNTKDIEIDSTDAELDGVIGDDDVYIDWPEYGYTDSADASDEAYEVSYTLELSGADAGNYSFTKPVLEATISKATITVTPDAESISVGQTPELTYTATTGNDDLDLLLSGVLTGTLTTAYDESDFEDADFGEEKNYDIEIGSLEVAESAANNYEIDFVEGVKLTVFNLFKQDFIVDTLEDVIYGAGDIVFNVVVPEIDGLTAEVDYSSDNPAVADIVDGVGENAGKKVIAINGVGTAKITVSRDGNTEYADYSYTQTLNVAQRELEITIDPDCTVKRVGSADKTILFTIENDEYIVADDDFTVVIEREAGEEVGLYDFIYAPTGTDADNYTAKITPEQFEIVDKFVDVITVTPIDDITYGEKATIQIEAVAQSGLTDFIYTSLNEDVATVDADGLITIVGAGDAEITVALEESTDYKAAEATVEFTVNTVELEITIDEDSTWKRVDTDNTSIVFTVENEDAIVDGDDFTVVIEREEGEEVGLYDFIFAPTGADAGNYTATITPEQFEIKDRLDDEINVTAIEDFTYGEKATIQIEAVADSGLTDFIYTSLNEDVATVDADGLITIVGAGDAEITVALEESTDYKAAEATVEFTVNLRELTITAIDYNNGTVEYSNKIDGDDVYLDIDSVVREKISVELYDDGTIARTTFELSNFILLGEDAANYILATETYTYYNDEEVTTITPTADEAVIDVAPAVENENGILITDVKPQDAGGEIESVVVNASDVMSGAIINSVSLTKDVLENIAGAANATLEITLNDSDESDADEISVSFDNNALTEINDASAGSVELSVTVDKPEDTELTPDQQDAKDSIDSRLEETEVYSFAVVDESGSDVLSNTANDAEATVTVRYMMPVGANKRVVVYTIDEDGGISRVSNTVYDSENNTVTITLTNSVTFLVGTETYSTGSSTINVGILVRHTVTFKSNGGTDVAGQLVKRGGYVTEPEDPTREGYEFDGWYIDEDLTEEFDFDSKVTGRLTLYASWIETDEETDEEVIEETEVKEMIFTDVSEDAWYFDAVEFVYGKGITNGVSETEFAPNGKVTRGQFITMLCRAYGIEEMDGDNFADCGDTWYTGYLAAAKQLGIANGVGDNMFAPDRFVTREEMVTLLYNYYKSQDMVGEEATETSFADDADVSAWAKAAVAYASEEGIINGKGDNMFDPRGNATRAELAQIFYNIFAWGE